MKNFTPLEEFIKKIRRGKYSSITVTKTGGHAGLAVTPDGSILVRHLSDLESMLTVLGYKETDSGLFVLNYLYEPD